MITRGIENRFKKLARTFKAVALTGPRQSGKTTLVKALFPNKAYISLENPDQRAFALEDPKGFFANLPDGAILDEIQRAPILFSYLQEILDNSNVKGLFILTGSNNLLLQESISQTLAGRVAYINLLPFTYSEIKEFKSSISDEELMISGFYPPVFDQKLESGEWYPSYIRTYIDRDVRQIKNITDLIQFHRFMRIIAGRTGQELNLSGISNEIGVDHKTVQSWVSVLEASYILFLLRPHHRNFNKTIIKRPKLYFYEPAIVCSLLGISTPEQLRFHPLKGSIFETMVVSEQIKTQTFSSNSGSLYYWRDKAGHEVDLLLENEESLYPIEIKSAQTINTDFFKNILYYNTLSQTRKGALIYSGEAKHKRSSGIEVVNWREFSIL